MASQALQRGVAATSARMPRWSLGIIWSLSVQKPCDSMNVSSCSGWSWMMNKGAYISKRRIRERVWVIE